MKLSHLAAGLLTLTFCSAQGAPVAPAFVDEVTFKVESDGDKRVMTVVSAPGLVRIDVPTDRMSLLYDPNTEHYTGLEHGNYTWWEFTWPEVRDAVENSTRYASRLRDIGPELLAENNDGGSRNSSTPTNAAPPDAALTSSAPSSSDDSGYVWRPADDKKEVNGIACVHWRGQTLSGEQVDAWCAPGVRPALDHAVTILRAVNEPMALVPVRDLMPPLAFVAWDALSKAGVTPLLMTWGTDADVNRVAITDVKQREGKLSYFQIPRLYVKTTLVTMDGIGGQKPPGVRHGAPAAPLPPHSALPTP